MTFPALPRPRAQVVLGPALLALAHLSLHEACRVSIVESGGLNPLVLCLRVVAAPPVLVHACKAIAALAMLPANKVRIAGADGVAALVDLLGEVSYHSQMSLYAPGRATTHNCLGGCYRRQTLCYRCIASKRLRQRTLGELYHIP
jgi:hypothetical protein